MRKNSDAAGWCIYAHLFKISELKYRYDIFEFLVGINAPPYEGKT